MSFKIEEISIEEFKKRTSPHSFLNHSKTLKLPGDLELRGEFEVTCREASGESVWNVKQSNLLTDCGRRIWMDTVFLSARIAFSQSTETPNPTRYMICSDASNSLTFTSATISAVNDPVTNTKTFSTTFSTPPVTRTLGTIMLCWNTTNTDSTIGAYGIAAYSLLTPAKTQTTTQTLEVVYRISMSPIS